MTRFIASWLGSLSLVAAVLVTIPTPALAGPPLICHPFDIGTAASLPFGASGHGWNATLASYDRSRLVADTVALLTPSTPILVRMETMRRATAYAAESPALAAALLGALEARAPKVARTKADALAMFDAAYLIESYRQLGNRGVSMKVSVAQKDGYAMLLSALQQMPEDPSLHFAAALMTTTPEQKAAHLQHLAKARQGARADALLARNLTTHYMAE